MVFIFIFFILIACKVMITMGPTLIGLKFLASHKKGSTFEFYKVVYCISFWASLKDALRTALIM